MSDSLDLTTLDDAGFARLYEARIKPCFEAHEPERLAALNIFKQRLAIGGAITAALVLGVGVGFRDGLFALFAALFAGVFAFAWAYSKLAAVAEKVKRASLTAIAEPLGVTYQMHVPAPPAKERLRALGLLPSHDRAKYEDRFFGTYQQASFDLYEAHLERKSTDSKGRTQWSTVFRGQCVRLAFPREFLGVTVVRRDAGVFNVFGGGKNLKPVRLEDPVFEKAFEVFSNDQVEARYLLHPMFMQRLVDLETALKGKRLRCAFEQGELLIAIEGGNLFEPGGMFKPLADPARARKIVDDIAGVLKVLDAVLTAQARRTV